jgi:hypothetical protein
MARKPKAKERKENAQRPDSQAGKELLLLWAILGEGGGKDVPRAALDAKGMLPPDDKKARDGLEKRGLIKKVDPPRDQRGRSANAIWMSVTEAGMAWAEENLAAIPAKTQAAAPILQAWLARLSIFLQRRNIPVGEFLGRHRGGVSPETWIGGVHSPTGEFRKDAAATTVHPDPSPSNGDYDALRARIRQAYLAVTGNRVNTRARLRDIREKLNDIDPAALESALRRMQREQQATLYPLDNKAEITEADHNAAIYFGSEPRHILWIER